jgi:hypothetical protein
MTSPYHKWQTSILWREDLNMNMVELSKEETRVTAEALMRYIENAICNGASPDSPEMEAAGSALNKLIQDVIGLSPEIV